MNGAEAIVKTLADCGVRVCFANPGTSEMHLVAALDREPRIRSVLCLFEGVATGAADGYGRFSDAPAATLLHLGPGYANGAANLHNARRARTPILNIVGEHATYHRRFDAPLASDIAATARGNSVWLGTPETPASAAPHAADAVAAALGGPGQSTLVVPADVAWGEAPPPTAPPPPPAAADVEADLVAAAAEALRAARKPALLLGGDALHAEGLAAAARLASLGVRVLSETFPARQRRGRGIFAPDRVPYFPESAAQDLAGHDLAVLAGAKAPVGFFAYPGLPSEGLPPDCERRTLVEPGRAAAATLMALADRMSAPAASCGEVPPPAAPSGALTPATVAASLSRHLPDEAIVVDDGVTGSGSAFPATRDAAPHDWVFNTGGAIGLGMPLAVGAALAQPERRVVCLSGDGAGMYTPQALWTMARERLPIVTVVFANRAYTILRIEQQRTGQAPGGAVANRMFSLDEPAVDWAALARSMGVDGFSTADAGEFDRRLAEALTWPEPCLIEARF